MATPEAPIKPTDKTDEPQPSQPPATALEQLGQAAKDIPPKSPSNK